MVPRVVPCLVRCLVPCLVRCLVPWSLLGVPWGAPGGPWGAPGGPLGVQKDPTLDFGDLDEFMKMRSIWSGKYGGRRTLGRWHAGEMRGTVSKHAAQLCF